MSRKILTMKRKENWAGAQFALPWVLGFLVFFAFPLFFSVVLAFANLKSVVPIEFDSFGFQNFYTALWKDLDFVPKLLESLQDIVVKTPIVVIFSFFISVLLNRELRFKGFFRVAFLLPVIIGTGFVFTVLSGSNANISVSAGAAASTTSSADTVGSFRDLELTNNMEKLVGAQLTGIITQVLGQVSDALWTSGIQIIIFLGALQAVPGALYEAAYCDGAIEWDKFWKITLPMCMPTILLVIVYTLIDYSSSLTNSVLKYTVETLHGDNKYALGSAMGWIYFLCMSVILALVFLFMRKANNTNSN